MVTFTGLRSQVVVLLRKLSISKPATDMFMLYEVPACIGDMRQPPMYSM